MANPPQAPSVSGPQAGGPSAHDPARLAPLLERLGARWSADACGARAMFPSVDGDRLAEGFASPLPDLGLLGVSGADAAVFLHNQLSNDVEHLPAGQARWYGYCSPKGRLLSTFLGWREADGFSLTVARPQAEALRKRLSMYVLRSKARVADRSDDVMLLGLGGVRVPEALAALGMAAPEPMAVVLGDGFAAAGLPAVAWTEGAVPLSRWLLAVPADRIETAWRTLCDTLHPASTAVWRRTEVLGGIPRIVGGAVEQFVPQMVNFELVGGVDFRKGCYPGQEVVARSQYLGKLKRRMFLAHTPGACPDPGADVLPDGGGEPLGQVVLAADAPEGGADLLFEARTDLLGGSAPQVGGVPLALLPLPYAVPST